MANIKVTPADEDEVIVAGAVALEPEIDSEPVPEPEPEPVSVPAIESSGESEFAVVSGSAKRLEPEAAPRPATTPDDLDAGPMPFAQKVVIVAAVVCIIGAVLYYLVVMR